MSQVPPRWQADIAQQFEPDTARQYIQLVESLLDDKTYDVIRQLASELILDLREMRDLTQQINQIDDPKIKALILFKSATEPDKDVTVAEFAQTLLARIQESRQLLNGLQFYALALAEEDLFNKYRPSR